MGNLLAAAVRMHGGMDRWRRLSTIRATVSASRHVTASPRPDMLFDLVASTRVPVLCLEQRSHDRLISSFRDGLLSVHGADALSMAMSHTSPEPTRTAWAVFGASEAIWIALNAPFVFAADGVACTETSHVDRPLRRLRVEALGVDGVAAGMATATFSGQGVLRALHIRRGGPTPGSMTVGLSAYGLQGGLLFARRQRLRVTGAAVGSTPGPLTLCLHSVTLD